MGRVVIIDGENLAYGVRELLAKKDEKYAPRAILLEYDFRGLIEELLEDQLPSKIIWFGAKLRYYDITPELKSKTKDMISFQAKFANSLMNRQKIIFSKAGYLRARETDICEGCKEVGWKLIEKGVDVAVATEVIKQASEKNEIILISSDSDLLPAVKYVIKNGAKVMFVGRETRPIASLSNIATSTRLITKPIAIKHKNVNKLKKNNINK